MDEGIIRPHPAGAFRGQSTRTDVEEDYVRLKQRAAQLEAIIDQIPEAIIATDSRGRLLHMNHTVEAILGRPSLDIEPQDWPEKFGFYLDDAKTYYPGEHMPLVRALSGESVEAEEMILRQADDMSPIWISMSARPIQDESGELTGAIILFRDITYRKQIELSRENHARRMEALYKFSHAIAESGNDLNSITQVVAVHSAENIGDACIVTLLNPKGDQLSITAFHHPDSSARALLRKNIMEIDHDLTDGIVGGVIQTGEPLVIPSLTPEQLDAITFPELGAYIHEFGIQGFLVAPINGRSGTVGSISLFRDRGGKPYTVEDQTFLTDMSHRTALAIENCRLLDSLREQITERLSAKEALNVSEERFRSIFESTTLGIKVLDLEGKILQTNPAFQSTIGYSEAELIGRHFYSFIYPADATRTIRLYHDMKTSGVPDFRLEHRILHKDGSIIWVKTIFTAVKKGGGDESLAFIVGIIENTTEQKRVELEMTELKNRLQGGMEMERLRLAQDLHDGPMQELYSSIYQLEGIRSQLEVRHQDMLEIVRQEIQKVLDELRSIAKELRPPTLADFGLEKAIRSSIEDFQEKYPDITVESALDQDQELLPENVRLALFRILQQSLANVVRHAEASQVNVGFNIEADEATLEIIDNGKGFIIPKNWMGFVRSGHFGLAGAAERIEALGGSFTVFSSPGKGTKVRVVVPYTESTN
jgi:PAS domain S-box-containing protein